MPASVTITFLRTNGTPVVTRRSTCRRASRFNVAIVPGAGSMAPGAGRTNPSARASSPRSPIVVERSLYTNANGVTWAAGTNATATRLP